MKRKVITDPVLQKHLDFVESDGMIIFFFNDQNIRGFLLHGTKMINEMRANHELGILETLALGQTYIATGLMSATQKGADTIKVKFECGGPIRGIYTDANTFGDIRGYLAQVPIPLEKPVESFDLSPFFGPGFVTVTRIPENAKKPFEGQVMMEYGSIAKDLALYYTKSEQTPTAFDLSIYFDKQGMVKGAGGLFIQAMPGSDPNEVDKIASWIEDLPSIGKYFSEGNSSEEFLKDFAAEFNPKILETRPVGFMCGCTHEKLGSYVASMSKDELKSIIDEEDFPVRITCHNCNSTYKFSKKEITAMHKAR